MNEQFDELYADAGRRLLGSVVDAGMDAATLAKAEKRLEGVRLPAALRHYYTTLGEVGLNSAHNQLFAPADWLLDGGHLVFMVENQGVSYWGVAASADPEADPPVFVGIRRRGAPVEWVPECETCSEFLLNMLHWQAVMGGFEFVGTADCPAGLGSRLGAEWQRAGAVGGEEAFGRGGRAICLPTLGDQPLLASLGMDPPLPHYLFAAARTESLFAELVEEFRALSVTLERL